MATEYGNRLRMARKKAGLTQIELSKRTGIAQSTISTAERGGNGSAETPLYAQVCGVSAIWLAKGEGPMEPAAATVALTAPSAYVSAPGGPGGEKNSADPSDAVEVIAAALALMTDAQREVMAGKLSSLAHAPDSATLKKAISDSLGSSFGSDQRQK